MTGVLVADPGPVAALASPYIGLVPFSELDAPVFFGRERETRIAVSNARTARVTVLYAASGVGKSSLVRAGVAHRLRSENEAVVVFDEWTGDPAAGIKAASARELRNHGGVLPDDLTKWTMDDVLCQRVRGSAGKPDREASAPQVQLTLVLDQFEDYLLYFPADAFATGFETQLARAANRADSALHLLIVVRDDALAGLDRLTERIPTLFNNQLRIDRLDRRAAEAAIRAPLAVYARDHPDTPRDVEQELIDQLLPAVQTGRYMAAQSGQERDGAAVEQQGQAQEDLRVEAPFLQLVLTKVWNAEVEDGSPIMRASTLTELGGAQRILSQHLDSQMQKLSPDQREVAARIFRFLVTPSGTLNAFSARDLAVYGEVPEDEVGSVLRLLAEDDKRLLRFVRTGRPNDPPRYEMYFQVLAAAALNWRRRFIALPGFSWKAKRSVIGIFGVLATAALAEAALQLCLIETGNWLLLATRWAAWLVLSAWMLVQIYRWFLRFVSMTGFLSMRAYRDRTLPVGLSLALAAFAFVGTTGGRPDDKRPWTLDWFAQVGTFDFVNYLVGTVLLSWAFGALAFATMQVVGQVTARRLGRFDLGLQAVFVVVIALLVMVIVLMAVTGNRFITVPLAPTATPP